MKQKVTNRPPAQIPTGVSDWFFHAAQERRALEDSLVSLFRLWSYDEIIPPTFEYADTLATEAGPQLAEDMYRFLDRDGRTLALRPDMTIPTARIVGTKLYDQPMPLRFFYRGSVFRYDEPQAGRQREFAQAGIELIGAATPEADAEVLALTVEALRAAGLERFHITLGQMAFFHGLLQEAQLPPHQIGRLRDAIDRKSEADLNALLAECELGERVAAAVQVLPTLNGSDGVLGRATSFVLNATMAEALDNLRVLETILDAYQVKEYISLDLGEVRGLEYYTGITFEGYAPGLGFSICNGGRYDELVGEFGPRTPAVGCALGIERLLLARQQQNVRYEAPAPHLIVNACGCSECLERVREARSAGARVEVDVLNRSGEELWHYAQQRGVPRVAGHAGPGHMHIRAGSGARVLDAEAWQAEVQRWIA